MGAAQLPVPAMRGWNVELRGATFWLYGPGGHDLNDRGSLPFARTTQGWWVADTQLVPVLASLELVQYALQLYRLRHAGGSGPEDPGMGAGPDRGVDVIEGQGPLRCGAGLVFTGLPEHQWEYERLRSLQFTYAELGRLLKRLGMWYRRKHVDATVPVLTAQDLDAWLLEGDTWAVYHGMRRQLERGRWPERTLLPGPRQLAALLELDRTALHPGAVQAALARLAKEQALVAAQLGSSLEYYVPRTMAAAPTVRITGEQQQVEEL